MLRFGFWGFGVLVFLVGCDFFIIFLGCFFLVGCGFGDLGGVWVGRGFPVRGVASMRNSHSTQ